jgi:hypothetical protein
VQTWFSYDWLNNLRKEKTWASRTDVRCNFAVLLTRFVNIFLCTQLLHFVAWNVFQLYQMLRSCELYILQNNIVLPNEKKKQLKWRKCHEFWKEPRKFSFMSVLSESPRPIWERFARNYGIVTAGNERCCNIYWFLSYQTVQAVFDSTLGVYMGLNCNYIDRSWQGWRNLVVIIIFLRPCFELISLWFFIQNHFVFKPKDTQ